jgi:hypothetical protein
MITDLKKYEGKAIMLTNQESQVENKFYRSQVVEVPITMDMFHDMGQGNFYPNKGLTNTISHAAGIEFLPSFRMNDTYGDEVIDKDGNRLKKIAGKECIKQGRKMKPDGTWTMSSPCAYEFNFMDRAEEAILKAEEKYNKEQSPIKKRKKILELKKFAPQRASTGAELMVVRELLGAKTAFTKKEIELGLIVVARIEKTEEFQEVLAIADVENRRNGGLIADRINDTANLLTGNKPDNHDFNEYFERPEKSSEQETLEPEKTEHKAPPNFQDDTETEEDPLADKKKVVNGLLDEIKADEGTRKYYTDVLENAKWIDAAYKWAVEELEKIKGAI